MPRQSAEPPATPSVGQFPHVERDGPGRGKDDLVRELADDPVDLVVDLVRAELRLRVQLNRQ
jgi:hypothetical protein